MVKEIQIGEEIVSFKSSGALPIVYRMLTGREFFADMNASVEHGDIMFDLAWVMFRHANPGDKAEEEDWLSRFEFDDINDLLPELVTMIHKESNEKSKAKKKDDQ